jgi:hypothetical protein
MATGTVRALVAVISVFLGGAASAEPLGDQANALKLITDTADKICNVVTAAGSSRSFDVDGQVKAELGGLASRLAGVGISGSGKLNEEQYQNVLRQDLAGTLRDNAACKLKVFETLSSKILSAAPPVDPAPNIAGRWRDNMGITYVFDQEGDSFRFYAFGASCRGYNFQTSGRGIISGRNVESSYSSSLPSGGRCAGTLFANGTEMTSTCNDTICGSFTASLIKQ